MKISNSQIQKLFGILFIVTGTFALLPTLYIYLLQNFIEPHVLWQFFLPIEDCFFYWLLFIVSIVAGIMILLKRTENVAFLFKLFFIGSVLQVIYSSLFRDLYWYLFNAILAIFISIIASVYLFLMHRKNL